MRRSSTSCQTARNTGLSVKSFWLSGPIHSCPRGLTTVEPDWLCVNTVFHYPAFVVIRAQPQLLPFINDHSPVLHVETNICCQVFAPFQRGLETIPGDIIQSLRHSFRTELLFFAVLLISELALRAEHNHPAPFAVQLE